MGARVELIAEKLATTDFCELVRTYSDDAEKKEECGVYVIPRGMVDQNLENAAFTTQANTTSVVATETGVHFVQTLQVIPTQVTPYAQVASNVQASLANNVLQQRLNLFLQLLRADATVTVYLG